MSAEGSSSKHPGQEERAREARNTNDSSKAGASKPRAPAEGWGHPHTCPGQAGGPAQASFKGGGDEGALCREDIIKGTVHAEEGARGTKPGFPGSKHWNSPPALRWVSLRWPRDSRTGSAGEAVIPDSRSQLPSPRPELWKSRSQ